MNFEYNSWNVEEIGDKYEEVLEVKSTNVDTTVLTDSKEILQIILQYHTQDKINEREFKKTPQLYQTIVSNRLGSILEMFSEHRYNDILGTINHWWNQNL